jgi:hypothetical protein
MNYQEQAYQRIQEVLGRLSGHERPADLIADLIHYCEHENELYDFEEELRVARLYADDEQQLDAESTHNDFE